MIIDFREIPPANGSDGRQDTFEFFAAAFFEEILGMRVISGPDRGADDGRDLIVAERLQGSFGDTTRRWLVSCKHYAHSAKAVPVEKEEDILGRVEQHKCHGFIAFYTSVPSSTLARKIEACRTSREVVILNAETIERKLLSHRNSKKVIERFFPESYSRWVASKDRPSNFMEYEPLLCEITGEDVLMAQPYTANIIFASKRTPDRPYPEFERPQIYSVHVVLKGKPDDILSGKLHKAGYETSWDDVSALKIPAEFIRWVLAILNQVRADPNRFTDSAFQRLKEVILSLSLYAMRDATDDELHRFSFLQEIRDLTG